MVTNDRREPEYHDVVTYRRLAERVGDYTRKGSLLLAQGRLHTDRWTAQDGGQRQRLGVIGESVQFLSRAPQQEEVSILMVEQLTSASCSSGCELTEHVEEVCQRQTEV